VKLTAFCKELSVWCFGVWVLFMVAIVNKKDLKQIEMGRSMQMIIDHDFCKILFYFPNGFSEYII